MLRTRTSLFMTVALFSTRVFAAPATENISLFNGQTLDGWKEVGGERSALKGKTTAFGGAFKVVDGLLTSDPAKSGNSFIATEREFGDHARIRFDFWPGTRTSGSVCIHGSRFALPSPGTKPHRSVKLDKWSTCEITVEGDTVKFEIDGDGYPRSEKASTVATPLRLNAGISGMKLRNIEASVTK